MSDFFPGSGPTFSEFWKRRPGGPDFTLNPFEMDAYDLGWALAHAGTMALWTHKTGMGVSANTFFGQIFFDTPITVVGRHAHTAGAPPTFTTGVAQRLSTSATVRTALRAAVPWAIASAGREVFEAGGFYDSDQPHHPDNLMSTFGF